ncbi:MAG: fimbrillin family protein [Bacteroidales bacterium]
MNKSLAFAAVAALTIFTGCSKAEALSGESTNQGIVEIATAIGSRGAAVNQVSDLTPGTSMGVYCAYTGQNSWNDENTPIEKMFNKQLTKKAGENIWSYNPGEEVRWEFTSITDRYTFFAYLPFARGFYTKEQQEKGNGIEVLGTAVGVPELSYKVPHQRVASQPDLLFAIPRRDNRYTHGVVQLSMQHALSQVTFAARTENFNKKPVTIKSITLKGIKSQGKAQIDGAEIQWELTGEQANMQVSTTGSEEIPASLSPHKLTAETTEKKVLSTADGSLFMIPQEINGTNKKLIVILEEEDGQELEFETELSAPGNGSWIAGKAYQYTIVYTGQGEIPYSIKGEISPWNIQEINEQIPGTYLSVSQQSIRVKKGKSTQVYFSTDGTPVSARYKPEGGSWTSLEREQDSYPIPCSNWNVGKYTIEIKAGNLSREIPLEIESA